jgi:hypothetical protein
VKLAVVASDVLGVSGRAMLEALLHRDNGPGAGRRALSREDAQEDSRATARLAGPFREPRLPESSGGRRARNPGHCPHSHRSRYHLLGTRSWLFRPTPGRAHHPSLCWYSRTPRPQKRRRIAAISARSCINEDGLLLREPQYGSRRTTGSSDEPNQGRSSPMRRYYVGLAVHSKQSAFVIEDEGGKAIARGEVPTTPDGFSRLQATYHLSPGTQVALETGTVCVLRRPSAQPTRARSGRGGRARGTAQGHRPNQKSDGRDALELCEGLRRGIYRSIVHVPREEISRLRDTLSRRRHFVRLQAAQVSAVKASLRAAGLGRLSRSLGSEAGWSRVIAALAQHQELRTYAEQHRAVWRCARDRSLCSRLRLRASRRSPSPRRSPACRPSPVSDPSWPSAAPTKGPRGAGG